jgi:uncharacterized membrane-anchored protein
MKKLILPVFILVVLVQWLVPGKMIVDRENIVRKGKSFRFLTEPVDPSNPFIGRYISLNFKEARYETNITDVYHQNQPIFVLLKNDPDGFAKVASITTTEPASTTDYVEATVNYTSELNAGKFVHIGFSFDKFYMEEYKAPKAEDAYRAANIDSTKKIYALVKIWKGRAVIENVFVDNKPILELIH